MSLNPPHIKNCVKEYNKEKEDLSIFEKNNLKVKKITEKKETPKKALLVNNEKAKFLVYLKESSSN